MGQDFRKLRALAALLPAGALGMSISLASAGAMAMASPGPVQAEPAKPASVALRLQAIRTSVSEVLDHAAKASNDPTADRETQLAWWGNGGWRNWGNGFNNGWGNGGLLAPLLSPFGNGGWNNWGNGWHNGWHNW